MRDKSNKKKNHIPKVILLGYINDGAQEHIRKRTGIKINKDGHHNHIFKVKNTRQLLDLMTTYNYAYFYVNNATFQDTIFLKHFDSHDEILNPIEIKAVQTLLNEKAPHTDIQEAKRVLNWMKNKIIW